MYTYHYDGKFLYAAAFIIQRNEPKAARIPDARIQFSNGSGCEYFQKIQVPHMHYLIAITLGLCTVCSGIFSLPGSIAVLAVYRFSNGMLWPILTKKSNRLLKSEIRATVMSYQSMATSILSILADPIIGVALDRQKIGRFYAVFGGIAILIIAVLWIYSFRQKNRLTEN